jgi:LCP family protein required for cell wall assembly
MSPSPARARARDPLWARLTVVVGAVLVFLSATTFAGGRALLARYTAAVSQEDLLGSAAATPAPGRTVAAGPLNLLLVGIDERAGDAAGGARADSIIIVHVPAAHDEGYLISIPRDTLVDIPAFPKSGYQGGQDKINAAFQYGSANDGGRAGGFQLLAATVTKLSGITFNAGAIVNFAGFQSLVGALGGVDMCVDEKVVSIHVGTDASGRFATPYQLTPDGPVPVRGVTPQTYLPGCQHLAAWQALDYVRQRELLPDGDYGRQRHQQQFLRAVLQKATSTGVLTDPVKLDAVLRAAGQAVTVDGGGASLADWAFTLGGVGPGNLTLIRTNGGKFNSEQVNGQSVEVLDDVSRQLLDAVRDDTVGDFAAAHPDWTVTDGQP